MTWPIRALEADCDVETVADDLLSKSLALNERPDFVKANTCSLLLARIAEERGRPQPRLPFAGIGLLRLYATAVSVALAALVLRLGLPSDATTSVLGKSSVRETTPQQGPPSESAVHQNQPPQTEPARWTEADLGATGRLFISPGTSFRLPAPTPPLESAFVVELDSGELCAQVTHRDSAVQGPFYVQAPHLRAMAVGTRFCVFAGSSPEASWVFVEEGQVRVERMGRQSTLAGEGSLVRGDRDGEPVSPTPASNRPIAVRPANVTRSASLCLSSRSTLAERECLWRHAGGAGLAAQNAFYLLGTKARDDDHDGRTALSIWQTYLHRFPNGALRTETQVAMFDELVGERRYEEALSVSEDLLKATPEYFRAGELEVQRGDLLAGALGRPRDAEEAYRHVAAIESRPYLRDWALFGLARCQEKLGEFSEARGTWRRYLQDFPQGPHAEEATRQLGTTYQ